VCAARDNIAIHNLGRWDRSNRGNCGRCRARRTLVEGYDTRARPFTRSEERLRAPGQNKTIKARSTGLELCGSSWNLKPKSGLIAVHPISVDRKLRDAKVHLPCGVLTRRRRDSGRRERLSGVINYGGNGDRCPFSRFRAHLAFPSRKLRVAPTRAMGQQPR